MSEENFQRAKQEESFRQSYIDSINIGASRKYVGSVVYDTDIPDPLVVSQTFKFSIAMDTRKNPRAMEWIPGFRSDIAIYPIAFEYSVVEDDFLSLVDHELEHSRQAYEDPTNYVKPSIDIELDGKSVFLHLTIKSELDAYSYQLSMIESGLRKVSPKLRKYVEYAVKRLSFLYETLSPGVSN